LLTPKQLEFSEELQRLIDKYWHNIAPSHTDDPDDNLDAITIAGMGPCYPAGWVLLITAESIDPDNDEAIVTRYTMKGQSYFTTLGMLVDQVQ